MIVLDASAALELLLRTPAGGRVALRLASPRETLHATHVLDLEIAQALRRFDAASAIDPGRATEVIADLRELDITRYGHELFLPRIWALRHNVTAYDAAYLALAEALEVPLLTRDARLAEAPGHNARIEMV